MLTCRLNLSSSGKKITLHSKKLLLNDASVSHRLKYTSACASFILSSFFGPPRENFWNQLISEWPKKNIPRTKFSILSYEKKILHRSCHTRLAKLYVYLCLFIVSVILRWTHHYMIICEMIKKHCNQSD